MADLVLVEKEYGGIKVPGIGCCKHVTERIEEAGFRHEFGPTTSPEEGFAKRFKAWFNKAENLDTQKVFVKNAELHRCTRRLRKFSLKGYNI